MFLKGLLGFIAVVSISGAILAGSLLLAQPTGGSIQNIVLDDYQSALKDPITINKVTLDGDLLKIKVSYSGGCKEHIFTLISSGFMESYPVQVNLVLSHNANNDSCEAWLTEELSYDLSPLKQAYQQGYLEDSAIIIMHLEGNEDAINYQF